MNKKGFTLIELLAVIIILGILMIIAIPSVTSYINDSRKNAYIDTAKEIVGGARNIVNEGKLGMYDTTVTYYIPAKYVNTENGLKSPYGEFLDKSAYIGVVYDGKGYKYYWISSDDTGQGIDEVTPVDKLDTDKIKSDLNPNDILDKIKTTGIGNRTDIKILNAETGIWEPIHLDDTSNNVSENGNSIETISSGNKICKRAEILHTDTCSSTNCGGSGTTITFGQKGTGNTLNSGDAFDCDVNDDGVWDSETERFYYVTDEGNNAVLIYYTNVSGGTIPTQNNYAYDSSDQNYHGPRTAAIQLPSISQWKNNQIVLPGTRQIVTETGLTISNDGRNQIELFTYTDKAARLLTAQELIAGCNTLSSLGNTTTGELNGCIYVLENIGTYVGFSGTYGYWLETPCSTGYNYVWRVDGVSRVVSNFTDNTNYGGVRPVITVSKTNIDY